jgi:hypothetical protein
MSSGSGTDCCGNCEEGLPCCSEYQEMGAVFTDQKPYTDYDAAGGPIYFPETYVGPVVLPMTGHMGGGLPHAQIPLQEPGMPDYAIPQAEIFAQRGYCGSCQGVGLTRAQKDFAVQGFGQTSTSSSSSVNWQGWAMAFAVLGISVAAGYGLAHVIRR